MTEKKVVYQIEHILKKKIKMIYICFVKTQKDGRANDFGNIKKYSLFFFLSFFNINNKNKNKYYFFKNI